MFKVILSEKSIKDPKKLRVESSVVLTKNDFLFIFNKRIKKVNKLIRKNRCIYIVTFFEKIINENVYRIDFFDS